MKLFKCIFFPFVGVVSSKLIDDSGEQNITDAPYIPFQDAKKPPPIAIKDAKDPPSLSLQDIHEPPSLSLRWVSKFSLGLTLPDGRQDEISLRHVDSVGGVAVPCLYTGFMHNDNTGEVAVLGCSNWVKTQVTLVSNNTSGMYDIVGDNSTVVIEDPYKTGNANNTGEEIVEVDDEENLEERQKRSIFPLEYEDYPFSFDGSKLDPVPQDVFYEMDIGYEDTFLEKMGGNKMAAEQYILSVVAHTQPHLKHASLGTRIHLNILHRPKYLQGRRLKVHDNNFKSIKESATIQNDNVPLAIFVATDDSDSWMGVSFRRYGCDPNKARLILKHRSSVQKAAQTLGHEVLHLYGNFHDEEEDEKKKLGLDDPCAGTGLMSMGMELAERPEQWSLCSVERLKRWYTNYGKCLKSAPQCSEASSSWTTPCLCGEGVGANLCGERHTCCEAATSTCLGMKTLDDVFSEMSWMKSELMKLSRQMELHHPPLPPQTTTTSTSTTTTTSPPTLPPQPAECSSYKLLSDAWRHIDYNKKSSFPNYCDSSISGSGRTHLTIGWYRFTGASGTKLPTGPSGSTNSRQLCGTDAVAYIKSGGNPTIQDGIVTRDVCFQLDDYRCWRKTTVKVAACRDIHGDFFVYQLKPFHECNVAYCAID